MASAFREDLRASAGILRAQRKLPLLSLAVFVGPQLAESIARFVRDSCSTVCPGVDVIYGIVSFASTIASIGFVGWVGVERLWYLRAYRGLPMPANRLMHFNVRYFRRYIVLALMWFWPVYLVFVVLARQRLEFSTLIWIVGAVVLVIDAGLTFVTPALAYSTRRASAASGEGLRMIKAHWPGGAPYVLVPPLAVVMIGRLSAAGPIGSLVISTAGVLLNLWFKGAIARFYLRQHPEVGEWGSAEASA